MKPPRIPWLIIFLVCLISIPSLNWKNLELEVKSSDDLTNNCNLPINSDYCPYITSNCDISYYSISYFYYCNYNLTFPLILISLLIIFGVITICVTLSILVSNYLFKNLNELTEKFHIGTSILSFILIPLSNAFADLINFNAAFASGSSNLVIGELIGSLLILFTLIIGSISILNSPYKIKNPKNLLIDLSWVLSVLVLFAYILSDGKFTFYECSIMSGLYIVYILFLYFSDKNKNFEDLDDENLNLNDALSVLSHELPTNHINLVENLYLSISDPHKGHSQTIIACDHSDEEPENDGYNKVKNNVTDKNNDFQVFLDIHNNQYTKSKYTPIDLALDRIPSPNSANTLLLADPISHKSSLNLTRTRSPIYEAIHNIEETVIEESLNTLKLMVNAIDMSLFLLVPVNLESTNDFFLDDEFDDTSVFGDNTSTQNDITRTFIEKILNWKRVQQSPLLKYWYVITTCLFTNFQFLNLPASHLILLIVTLISLVGLTHDYMPTSYKEIFVNLVGVFLSIIITSNITLEILQILKNLGLIWRISEYLLGLVVFSISNSLNDFVTNLTLSAINPSFGINACLGTPMITILLGIGFNGLFLSRKDHESIKFALTKSVVISMVSLVMVILMYLVYLPLNKWQFDKRIGYISIAWYFGLMGINFYLGS